jgi:hypothetical protein
MIGFHVTTSKKIGRYINTGAILPPVRFWPNEYTAQKWAAKTGRDIILKIECFISYPLPDHIPARWTPEVVRKWEIIDRGRPDQDVSSHGLCNFNT